MNRLRITRIPVGWQEISSTDNEIVLAMSGRCAALLAKIMLLPYSGSARTLRMKMQQNLPMANSVGCERGELLCNNIKWSSSYYMCREEKEYTEMETVSSEMEVTAGLIQKLVDENATRKLDQHDYRKKYDGYASRYAALESRMDSLEKERERKEI